MLTSMACKTISALKGRVEAPRLAEIAGAVPLETAGLLWQSRQRHVIEIHGVGCNQGGTQIDNVASATNENMT